MVTQMSKVKGYGCTSIIHALCLQFSLAGLGLRCSIHRTPKGQWVVEAQLRDYTRSVSVPTTVTPDERILWYTGAPDGLCDCRQGRDPCTCKAQGVAHAVQLQGGI